MNVRGVFGPGASGWPAEFAFPAGDGPRTALRIEGGRPRHLAAHLDRLIQGAEVLTQPAPWVAELQGDLEAWTAARTGGEGVLRLALYPAEGLVAARLEVLPVTPDPYRLALLPHPLGDLRGSPLAGHKGLTGPWRTRVLSEAKALGAEDALLLWPDGTLAETAIASMALERGPSLILPPREGRVSSLGERLDLPAWAEARGLRMRWESISSTALGEGRLWCVNAARGIWSATLI